MDTFERELREYADVFTPRFLSQFLGVHNWTVRPPRPFMQTWLNDPGTGTRISAVHLPTDETLVDYHKRLYEAVHDIASIYDLGVAELAEQVASIRADLYFVRIQGSAADGTIPFREAGNVLDSIEKLVRAAASRTGNPTTSGRGRTSERVKDFLDEDLRMGHTKRGSFIITVAARLQHTDPIDQPLNVREGAMESPARQQDMPEVDFSRRVMTTLSRALSVTQRHLSHADDFIGFDEAVEDGMLAPIVEAIDELAAVTNGGGIDMSFEWAPALPQSEQVPGHIVFSPAALERAPNVVRRFERREQLPEVENIFGFVVALEREQADNIDSGEVIVQVSAGGSTRKVRVELSGTDYRWAILAHSERLPFTVSGRLGKKGNRWALIDSVVVDTTYLQAWQRARIEKMGGDASAEIDPPALQ